MDQLITVKLESTRDTAMTIPLIPSRMYNGSLAGRSRSDVTAHIEELRSSGVEIPDPKHVPSLYAVGIHLLTTSDSIQVHGSETGGEVEYVLFWFENELFLTVGSDHTDFWVERFSSPKAKNVCQNVMATACWRYSDVLDHFDTLRLESEIFINGGWKLYQKDTLEKLLPPEYWIQKLQERSGGRSGLVFFSGTINTLNSLECGNAYRFRIIDPILDRQIEHEYECEIISGIEDY